MTPYTWQFNRKLRLCEYCGKKWFRPNSANHNTCKECQVIKAKKSSQNANAKLKQGRRNGNKT